MLAIDLGGIQMRVTACMLLLLFAPLAYALPVTWHLVDVQIDQGYFIEGSYTYDADLNVFTNVAIETLATPWGNSSFDIACSEIELPCGDIGDILVFQDSGSLTPAPVLYLELEGSMSNAGGSLQISIGCFGEPTCPDASNSYLIDPWFSRNEIVSGYVVAAVPIPAAVWLFGSALAAVGWMRRKQNV
jgi:hypothetical protein